MDLIPISVPTIAGLTYIVLDGPGGDQDERV
jgi:hypothetical protein